MQTTPTKAIRKYCLSCCLEQPIEVKLCPDDTCPLHPFRMGKNPYRKPPSEKQIESARNAARIRMAMQNNAQNVEK